MDLSTITPLILTYNEAPNLDRTLPQLTWAHRIVVIDSYSNDETLEILSRYPNVQVYQRSFDSFAAQCNFGLGLIATPWTLSLDADYVLSSGFSKELERLDSSFYAGFQAPFRYWVFGAALRGTLLPPRTVLYRTTAAQYDNDGHAHRVRLDGPVGDLSCPIHHDDRKPLSRWLWAQNRYMVIEAKKLLQTPTAQLSLGDKIRKQKLLAPFVILIYCLILKGGLLDGWRGLYYALQRMFAELLLSLHLIEADQNPANHRPG
jgi:glycosyltransferase involved in cell wall biosynthesis